MVIALCAVLATPVAAQECSVPLCPRAQVYNGCHLSVAVSTYIKVDGNFIPQSTFDPPNLALNEEHGDCFYVNAVVVNDGNSTANAPINATLTLPSGVALAVGEEDYAGQISTKTWPGSQGEEYLDPGRIADFWWKVCCIGAYGNQTIRVNATAGAVGTENPECFGEGETTIVQEVSGNEKCIEIKIVEAPGLAPQTGRLTYKDAQDIEHPVVYTSDWMPDVIMPCQNFGIKAEVTNLCDVAHTIGNVSIAGYESTLLTHTHPALDPTLFDIVGGDPGTAPQGWLVGELAPGQTAVVAWTLHCEGPGNGNVSVWAPGMEGITTHVNNPVLVHQQTPGALIVEITQPVAEENCLGYDEPIKQATNCANTFPLQAKVTNLTDSTVVRIEVKAAASRPGWVSFSEWDVDLPQDLAPGESATVDFGDVTCLAAGLGNITVSADGRVGTTSGPHIYSQSDYSDPRWWVTINQQDVIAAVAPYYVNPGDQNICDPQGFDVIFRYYNWSDIVWPISGNLTSCVEWGDGNVSLESVSYYKNNAPKVLYVTTPPPESVWIDLTPTVTTGQACVDINETICKCCGFDVRWHFNCTGEGDVTFYGNVTVEVPGFSGGDTSEPVCIHQEWKAELWTDIAFFFQDNKGIMIEQDAMVPNNDFHVVIPVINTGDAGAEDVQVYFTIGDTPKPPCTKSYDFLSASGDATVSFNENTGIGTATFDYIPGHSAEKAVLLMHCLCEGEVSVIIPENMLPNIIGWTENEPGLKGFDENTGEGIPWSNVPCEQNDIHVPPCPMIFKQVPFTVTIENPITCQTFIVGDLFAVKALIHNGSSQDFIGMSATLHVVDAKGNPILGTQVSLVSPQNNPKTWANITKGLDVEITWQVQCTVAGEAYISVSATSGDPLLTAYSDEVNVHQIAVPHPDIEVQILSPQDTFGDDIGYGGDTDNTAIGTGEQFAVTALVYNIGDAPAQDVQLGIATNQSNMLNDCIWTNLGSGDGLTTRFYLGGCVQPGTIREIWVGTSDVPVSEQDYTVTYGLMGIFGLYTQIDFNTPPLLGDGIWTQMMRDFSIIEGEMVVPLGDIQPGGYQEYTWTLQGESTCWPQCTVWPYNIDVAAWTDSGTYTEGCDEVDVILYPAAHLVAKIDSVTPSTTIGVCSEFTVHYTVTNIGQADAWNASVTLSTQPEYSVRIAAGQTGYTQNLGTIPGWKVDGTRGTATGTFVLHCKQACETTINITPTGYDECGYTPLKQRHDWEWEGLPGSVIQSKFLEPASITVKGLENGVDMAITKTANKTIAPSGTAVTFTIRVTNNGPIAASGIVVADTFASGLTSVAVSSGYPTQGTYTKTSTLITWNVGSLPVSGTATLVYTGNSNTSSKITNTATVTSAEADGYLDNNTASVELNVTSMQFTLKPGWNLFSLPLVPGNSSTVNVVGGITQVAYVYGYDAETGTWSWWAPPNLGTLPDMTDGWGYWIYLTGSVNKNITITGTELPPVIAGSQPPVPPSYDVFVGWNLLGFKSTTAKAENFYLAGIAGDYTKIYGYADGAYFNVVGGANLQPGMGYWIAVPGAVPGTKVGSIFP